MLRLYNFVLHLYRLTFIDDHNSMHMVWHNDEFIQFHMRKMVRGCPAKNHTRYYLNGTDVPSVVYLSKEDLMPLAQMLTKEYPGEALSHLFCSA